jgi:hypothetical protein
MGISQLRVWTSSVRPVPATFLYERKGNDQKWDQDDDLLETVPLCVCEFRLAFFLHSSTPRN